MDSNQIEDICHTQGQLSAQVTKEVKNAIKELNKGKTADAMGITAKHCVYAEDSIIDSHCLILNKLFVSSDRFNENRLVFKKKGSNSDSKNYRGITVIQIITKVLELVIRARLKQLILEKQNKSQRGFTEKSSPMNTALILEEYIRDRRDI